MFAWTKSMWFGQLLWRRETRFKIALPFSPSAALFTICLHLFTLFAVTEWLLDGWSPSFWYPAGEFFLCTQQGVLRWRGESRAKWQVTVGICQKSNSSDLPWWKHGSYQTCWGGRGLIRSPALLFCLIKTVSLSYREKVITPDLWRASSLFRWEGKQIAYFFLLSVLHGGDQKHCFCFTSPRMVCRRKVIAGGKVTSVTSLPPYLEREKRNILLSPFCNGEIQSWLSIYLLKIFSCCLFKGLNLVSSFTS